MTFCLPAVRCGQRGGESEEPLRIGLLPPSRTNKWPWAAGEEGCDSGVLVFSQCARFRSRVHAHRVDRGGQEALFIRALRTFEVHFIRRAEEWESPADTTERYTLRPTMAVDGRSANYSLHLNILTSFVVSTQGPDVLLAKFHSPFNTLCLIYIYILSFWSVSMWEWVLLLTELRVRFNHINLIWHNPLVNLSMRPIMQYCAAEQCWFIAGR